jgi:uncharacterized protein (TIGR03435 family)
VCERCHTLNDTSTEDPLPDCAASGRHRNCYDLAMLPRTIRRTRRIAAIPIFAGAAWAVTAIAVEQAQPQTANRPKFEVASIKPCKAGIPDGRSGGGPSSPGRLNIECQPLRGLIQMAYDRFATDKGRWGQLLPIDGAPPWINSDRFTIEAKAGDAKAGGPPSEGTVWGPMLRALLEDRFKVKVHRESREVPVYELVTARGGVKLEPFKEGTCAPHDFTRFPPPDDPNWCRVYRGRKGPNVSWFAQGASLAEFCILLSSELDRPVIDKTGIAGRFGFSLEYAPDPTSLHDVRDTAALDDPAAAPSIFTALGEQLGLRLVSAKGPGEFLVIDHVERPSEN